jgi:hypothetical protein
MSTLVVVPTSLDPVARRRKDWKGDPIVSTPPPVNDRPMATEDNPRLTLELETGADPIRGSIEHADGSRQSFWGWLELSQELRRVAGVAGPQATRPRPHTTAKEQP